MSVQQQIEFISQQDVVRALKQKKSYRLTESEPQQLRTEDFLTMYSNICSFSYQVDRIEWITKEVKQRTLATTPGASLQ